jgi:hypothetical protein
MRSNIVDRMTATMRPMKPIPIPSTVEDGISTCTRDEAVADGAVEEVADMTNVYWVQMVSSQLRVISNILARPEGNVYAPLSRDRMEDGWRIGCSWFKLELEAQAFESLASGQIGVPRQMSGRD